MKYFKVLYQVSDRYNPEHKERKFMIIDAESAKAARCNAVSIVYKETDWTYPRVEIIGVREAC